MKRLIFIILFTSIFFSGCASLKAPKRHVKNNIFYSSRLPKLKIKFDNNLKFVDKSEDSFFRIFSDLGSHILSKVEVYKFLDNSNSKGVLIRIITLPDNKQVCFWPPKSPMLNNSVSSGVINLNREMYHYHIYAIKQSANNFLFKSFVRNVNATDTVQLQIYYFEKVADNGLQFIPEFSERANKCIQILPLEGEA